LSPFGCLLPGCRSGIAVGLTIFPLVTLHFSRDPGLNALSSCVIALLLAAISKDTELRSVGV
jgi:hypothetical protein